MNEFHKVPNLSHEILNQILNGIFYSKSSPDVELWFGYDITWDYKSVLYLKLANLFNDDLITSKLPHDKLSSIDDLESTKSWDLIFIEAPFGRTSEQFKSILPVLNNLSEDGTLLYLLPHLSSLKVLDNKGLLKENNIYPSSVLQLPKGFYGNLAGLQPILVSFEKQKPFNLVCFIDYKEDEYGNNVGWFVQRHKSGGGYETLEDLEFHKKEFSRTTDYLIDEIIYERFQEDNDLEVGIQEDLHEFPGFESWKFMISLAHIKSDYKGYKRLNLKDVATEINLNRDTFTHKENSVYIALIGTQKAVNSLEELRVKHQNVCQVVVNKDIILETYLATYLNSHWGKIFWEAAIKAKPGLIKRLTKKDISNLVIALPSLKMQQDIYQTTNKIENAIDELEEIKKSLTINPISSEKERRKLDHISEIIAGFEPLLREESKTYEFKASLQTPYPDLPEPEVDENDQLVYKLGNQKFQSEKQIKAFLQHIVMKTIASFINTIGGTLVIGVHEKDNIKEVVGIDREGVGSYDKYERHLSQLVSNQLNKLVASKYVSTKIVEHESLAVCIVNCEQNQEDLPVFLDGEVYRRTGALIEKLSTKEVARLVRDQRKL